MNENFGVTPLESMATGKPIIAVREDGYLESMIEEETELLVETNIENIVRTISIVAKDPEKYKNNVCKEQKFLIHQNLLGKRKM